MSVGGKALPATFCWLSIGQIWKIKIYLWLKVAFDWIFKLEMSFFLQKMPTFSTKKKKNDYKSEKNIP